jgi:anti-sigma factor RsiW
MADGSLTAESEQRMHELMAADPGIAAEVARARQLRRQLRGLTRMPVPTGLGRRLFRIPAADRPRAAYWAPVSAFASVVAAAIGLGLFLSEPGPSPEQLASEKAMQEFAIVMAYLQKSAGMASNEATAAVGYGVLDAWAIGRGTLSESVTRGKQGEQGNDD